MKREYLSGWILLVILALVATQLSSLVTLGGKHPLEASALAIILGIAIRNLCTLPPLFLPGIAASDKLLILGIVLMGASLDISSITAHGMLLLCIIVAIMLLSLALIFGLGKIFKLNHNLSLLLAVGTTICGTTAVAIIAPLIKAKEEETSYAVGTIALFGLVAILLYPTLGSLLGVNDFAFGVFAGTAIHSTPQVVGAGYMYSESAGQTATTVKLIRNCFIAPLALLIALLWNRKSKDEHQSVSLSAAFPWFLFGYFAMGYASSRGYFSAKGIEASSNAGKFLILLAMAGIGLNTPLNRFKSIGYRPFLVGMLGTALLAVVSAALIWGVLSA